MANPLDQLLKRNGTLVDHLYYVSMEEKLGGVLARAEMSEKVAGQEWVKGHFRGGKYVPGYRREEERKPAKKEFAPGLPSKKRMTPLPVIEEGNSRIWEFGVHDHHAIRRGRHFDLRLGDPRTGIAHSWSLTALRLPESGKPIYGKMQPDHTVKYMDFKGTIGEGYGAGRVDLYKRGRTEIIYSSPTRIKFATYEGREISEYALIRMGSTDIWKMYNVTATRERHPDLPSSKPKYKETKPEKIDLSKEDEIIQAKVDGAHVLVDMNTGKQTRVFSYRPTERKAGVIDHTQRVPGVLGHRGDKAAGNTLLRGEVYAVDKDGKALPAQDVGGMLNANVWKSRALQEEKGKLTTAIFDVVKFRGKNVESAPYSEKLRILREIVARDPDLFHMPDTAETQEEKEKLYKDIKEGKHKQTSEGVIVWKKDEAFPPTKAKHRPDFDIYVRGIFPAQSRTKHPGHRPSPAKAAKVKKVLNKFLEAQGLPADTEYVVTAGASLYFHGLRPDLKDLDVFVPGMKKDHVVMNIDGMEVDAYNSWMGLDSSFLENKQRKMGIPVASMQDVLDRMLITKKGKDKPKIEMIQGLLLDRAGGFTYSYTPDGPIVGKVGTGFDHKTLRDMKANPDKYVGRVAKVRSLEKMRGKGALRAPSFSEWHMEKGKEKTSAEVWTPSKIHKIADKLGIAWDDDPKFKRFSEEVTGVSCLDKMSSAQRKSLAAALIRRVAGGGEGLAKQAEQQPAWMKVLPSVGALTGGIAGAATGKGGARARTTKALLTAITGAGAGWLPSVMHRGYKTTKTEIKKHGAGGLDETDTDDVKASEEERSAVKRRKSKKTVERLARAQEGFDPSALDAEQRETLAHRENKSYTKGGGLEDNERTMVPGSNIRMIRDKRQLAEKLSAVEKSPFSPQIKRPMDPQGKFDQHVRLQLEKSRRVAKFEGMFNARKVPRPINPVQLAPRLA